jgi:hypothetical protein
MSQHRAGSRSYRRSPNASRWDSHGEVADEVDHVEVQPLRELLFERQRLREVEARLKEQDGDVAADLRRHVHHDGSLGLERRGDRDPIEAGLLDRPAQDVARVGRCEALVRGA